MDLIQQAKDGDQQAQEQLLALPNEEIFAFHYSVIYELGEYFYLLGNSGKSYLLFSQIAKCGDATTEKRAIIKACIIAILHHAKGEWDDTSATTLHQALVSYAEEGDLEAQVTLATFVENRSNVKIVGDDDVLALYWYKKAYRTAFAESGTENVFIKEAISRIQPKVEALMLERLEKAENGDVNAHEQLIGMHIEVVELPEEILKRYLVHLLMNIDTHPMAAALAKYLQDNCLARLVSGGWADIFMLSCVLWSVDRNLDEGREPNLKDARVMIYTLAESGYAPAQYWQGYLAENYITGTCFGTDPILYYRKAATQGLREARVALARYARSHGRCRHCGGVFKGLFSKKCTVCRRAKDY